MIDPVDRLFPEPEPDDNGVEHAPERPIDRFRKTATGSVIAAGMLGLRDVLEGRPEKEEVAIVSEAPDEPSELLIDGFVLELDPDDPSSTRVVLPRPPTSPN